jgi:LysR family transcriptional regulator, nitrogen assimilation regulatory protein
VDVKQLRYFLGVLDKKSFTKAAQFLHIAQPALGLHIRRLEAELGVKLLVRHSRGIVPTEAGTLLARYAESVLKEFQRMRQDMLDFSGTVRGNVTIGLSGAVVTALGGRLIEQIRRKHPEVSLRIVEGLSERLMEWLDGEALDVALTYNLAAGRPVIAEPLIEDTLQYLVRAKARPKAKTMTLAEALNERLILPSRGHMVRNIVEEEAAKLGRRVECTLEVDSVLATVELVKAGLGPTITPASVALSVAGRDGIVALPVTKPELRRTLNMAFSARRPPSKALDAVCTEIRLACKAMVDAGASGWRAMRTPADDTPGEG